jgi:predicted SnoaL-like aldol condensation-catalyzing enzyme
MGSLGRFRTPLRLSAVAAVAAATFGVGFSQVASGGGGHGRPDHGRKEHSAFAPFNGEGESTHCPRSKKDIERNKRNVVAYYTTAFNDKDPEKAVRKYGGREYIQHNPLAPNGFDAFITFVNDFTTAFPDVHIDIRRVFAECDFVITHGLLTGAEPVFTELGSKVVDIFRVDRRGKIVEHWDVLAAISPTNANGNPEV